MRATRDDRLVRSVGVPERWLGGGGGARTLTASARSGASRRSRALTARARAPRAPDAARSAVFIVNIVLGNYSLDYVPVSFMQTVKVTRAPSTAKR